LPTGAAIEPGSKAFLGTPFQPNSAVSATHEYVVLLRKPGQRRVSLQARGLSALQPWERERWLRPYWRDVAGVGSTAAHPAPFPEAVDRRHGLTPRNGLCSTRCRADRHPEPKPA
jgi:hypothetical protein